MMNVVIDAGRFILCPAEALDEALSRVGVDRKGLVEVAEGVYATAEAIEAASAREGVDRKGLVELAEGVYATPEAIEAAKKPRKVFNFLPTLNTCGREARRALEILFKK